MEKRKNDSQDGIEGYKQPKSSQHKHDKEEDLAVSIGGATSFEDLSQALNYLEKQLLKLGETSSILFYSIAVSIHLSICTDMMTKQNSAERTQIISTRSGKPNYRVSVE